MVTCFLPGYLLYAAFLREECDTAETQYAIAFALSIPVVATIHFVTFVTGRNEPLTNGILYVLVVGALYLGARARRADLALPSAGPAILFALFSLYCTLLLTITPAYAAAYMYDWGLYYPNMFFYLRQVDPSVFSEGIPMEYLVRRTPFFSLVNAFFLAFSGNTYAAFQAVSTFLNSLIFWAVLVTADRFCGRKTAKLALLLLPVVPIIICRIPIPTPKPVSAYLLLLTFVTYHRLRSRKPGESAGPAPALVAILAVTSYMVHPMSLLYLAWLGLDYLWLATRKRVAPEPRLIAWGVAALLLLVVPWFAWALARFGIERVLVPSYTISENPLPPLTYVSSRITILAATCLVPEPLTHAMLYSAQRAPGVTRLVYWGHPLLRTYLETFLGGFTFTGAAFLVISWLRTRKPAREGMRALLSWAALGAATCLAVHFLVDLKGLAFNIMAPLVVLFLVFLCHQAVQMPRRFLHAMASLVLCEYVFVRFLVYRLTLPAPRPAPHVFDVVRAALPFPVALFVSITGVSLIMVLYVTAVARQEE